MPIYEYQCGNCDNKLEALQKISDDPLTQCPACDRQELKKLISAASFRLKGSGWYETDFKTGDKRQLAESESVASSDSKANDTAGTDKAGSGEKPTVKESKENKQSKGANQKSRSPGETATNKPKAKTADV
tara:strand:- start:998 stop:1390 length:393 start_codon:yes stop_codon:yes gene_type:complete